MITYFFTNVFWLTSLLVQLIYAMGTGVEWVTRAIRMAVFIILIARYFIGHWWWYFTSPDVIRSVSYRASALTRRENIMKVISGEWVNRRASSQRRMSFSGLLRRNGGEELTSQIPSELNTTNIEGEVGNVGSQSIRGTEAQGSINLSFSLSKNPQELLSESLQEAWIESNQPDVEIEVDAHFNSRARLDIILPVPLDSLLQSLAYARANKGFKRKKFPIAIFVSGGAWIIGSHLWGSLVGRLLAAHGYVVFCPDYRNFPQTDMEGMVLDVSDAIKWVLQNAERYNGDLKDVTLVGQSAGAHLTMMSLLSQAQLHAQSVVGGPAPSKMAYNVQRYNPRQSIHRYVGLSGIYNLRGLVKHFHRRGLYSRVLYQIAGGRANMPRYSLNSYFDERRCSDTGEVIPSNIFDFFPQRMFFIHGDADCSAPVSESANLAFVMRNAQRDYILSRVVGKDKQYSPIATPRGVSEKDFITPRSCMSPVGESPLARDDVSQTASPSGYTLTRSDTFDSPITAIDIEWLLIPDASHTDPILEEVLLGSCSCCVDFICDYEFRKSGMRLPRKLASSKILNGNNNSDDAEDSSLGILASMLLPDASLPLRIPYENRPWLMRMASFVCPF